MSLFVGSGRYSDCLDELGGIEVIRLDYEDDYQGHIDVDVLLNDGRVFSYCYSYGSCSGCDEWESRGMSYDQIIDTMRDECTIFSNRYSYNRWRREVEGINTPENFLDDELFDVK